MPDQDAIENKALEAANDISKQVGLLWMQAHTDGLRNGLEAGALIVQGFTDALAAEHPGVVPLLELMRDQIRLSALQVADPATP